METLGEFLNNAENQAIVLGKIIEGLRRKGEWGKRGIFTSIGENIGFSGAYVGQVFNKTKPLRENFALKMMEYLGVSVAWLCGESENNFEDELVFWKELEREAEELDKKADDVDELRAEIKILEKMVNYKSLVTEFCAIPDKQKEEALMILAIIKKHKDNHPNHRKLIIGNED